MMHTVAGEAVRKYRVGEAFSVRVLENVRVSRLPLSEI
jgi:hypothetical protein